MIKDYNPTSRKIGIGPHLRTFLADSVIQEILGVGDVPAHQLSVHPANSGNDIQNTLKSLSKAIQDIQRKLSTPTTLTKATSTTKRAGATAKPSLKTYSAVAGSRPPNPSLVVDLAHLGIASKD
jgi:hypothetical protein